MTVAEAVGAVGVHAGNSSPEANPATEAAGLGLAPGLGGLAVPEGVEAGAVAPPGSVDDEGAGVVHADSVMRTATSAAAMGLCKVPSLALRPRSSSNRLVGPSVRRSRHSTVLVRGATASLR